MWLSMCDEDKSTAVQGWLAPNDKIDVDDNAVIGAETAYSSYIFQKWEGAISLCLITHFNTHP